MPQKTIQEVLAEEEEKRRLPSIQQLLANENQLPTAVDGIQVNTSPIDLPAPYKRPIPRVGREMNVPGASLTERALAASGVDTRTGLQDFNLRKAIGFSPSQSFTADFLQKKLAEKHNIPPEYALRMLPTGDFVFFNPDSRRYTTIDEQNVSKADIADFYGPAHTLSPAIAGGVIGSLGGPWGSIAAGASGALFGEAVRLLRGRDLGVHDMTDEQIFWSALKVGGIDAAAGAGGLGAATIIKGMRKLLMPSGMHQSDAERLLANLQSNQETVDQINNILSRGGSDKRFILTAAEQAEDPISIAALDSASAASNHIKGRRISEQKAAEGALEAATRISLGVDEATNIVSRSSSTAAPAQRALIEERRRLQSVADDSLVAAQQAADDALAKYGTLNQAQAGGQARDLLNLHVQTLENTKNNAWIAYQTSIGQPVGGAASTELVSNIKVPVTQRIVDAYRASQRVIQQSLIDKKTAGPIALKKPELGSTIDLAVLDENIKVLRRLGRSSSGDINTRQINRVERELVALRNDYLAIKHPQVLQLLDEAEAATGVYKRFVDESIFSRILTQDSRTGKFILNDVSTFRAVWNDTTGAAMGELIDVAKKHPGGLAALRDTGYRLYKANVTKGGVLNKSLHDKFVESHKEVLNQLFIEPRFYRFGKFADNVERLSRRADRIQSTLARSPLGRLGDATPEGMARKVFVEQVSVGNIRSTMNVLESAGPEAVQSFQDSVGKQLYKMLTQDNSLSSTKFTNVLQDHKEKLTLIFGETFVKDNMTMIRQAINLARQSGIGGVPRKSNLFMKLARAWITPPLTKKGRFQTFAEAAETQAMTRAFNAAIRDPKILRAIVAQGERDIRDKRVVTILSQIGATSLIVDDRILEE